MCIRISYEDYSGIYVLVTRRISGCERMRYRLTTKMAVYCLLLTGSSLRWSARWADAAVSGLSEPLEVRCLRGADWITEFHILLHILGDRHLENLSNAESSTTGLPRRPTKRLASHRVGTSCIFQVLTIRWQLLFTRKARDRHGNNHTGEI